MINFVNLTEHIITRLKATAPFFKKDNESGQFADISNFGSLEDYLKEYIIEILYPINNPLIIRDVNTTIEWKSLDNNTLICIKKEGHSIVDGIPEPKENVLYITSLDIVKVAKRPDVVCPISIKDSNTNNILGAYNFYSII